MRSGLVGRALEKTYSLRAPTPLSAREAKPVPKDADKINPTQRNARLRQTSFEEAAFRKTFLKWRRTHYTWTPRPWGLCEPEV